MVALKKEGVATILVHHSNKTDIGFRGSTNLATTLETIVALKKVEGAKAAEGAVFRIQFEKSRSRGQPQADGKTLKLEGGRWVSEVDEFARAAEVVAKARSLRYKNQKEIADELGVNQATISRIFEVAETLGLATKEELKDQLYKARMLEKRLAEPAEPDDGASDIDL